MSIFKAALPLKNDLGWLIEADDFLICSSKEQVSCFLRLKPPFHSSGYWDDMALCALLSRNKVAVLGSGMGSFLPLCKELKPDCHFWAVDINDQFHEVMRRVSRLFGIESRIDFIRGDVIGELSRCTESFDGVFIDLFSAEGVSPLAADPDLHGHIQGHLDASGLVFVNVADRIFEREMNSPTWHFINRILPFYAQAVILRRPYSSTLVFSRTVERDLGSQLESAVNKYPQIWGGILSVLPVREGRENSNIQSELFKFSDQAARMDHAKVEYAGVLGDALKQLQALSSLDLVRLSRVKTELLGGLI